MAIFTFRALETYWKLFQVIQCQRLIQRFTMSRRCSQSMSLDQCEWFISSILCSSNRRVLWSTSGQLAALYHTFTEVRSYNIHQAHSINWHPPVAIWLASYNASKAALHHYGNTLRAELKPFGYVDFVDDVCPALHSDWPLTIIQSPSDQCDLWWSWDEYPPSWCEALSSLQFV